MVPRVNAAPATFQPAFAAGFLADEDDYDNDGSAPALPLPAVGLQPALLTRAPPSFIVPQAAPLSGAHPAAHFAA